MRASGNGDPAVCVQNLLRTWRGEVPYERLKGLDPTPFDRPYGIARPAIEADAAWVVSTYEPRVTAQEAVMSNADLLHGDFNLTMSVSENEA